MTKDIKKTAQSDRDKYFEELDQMEAELGGNLVSGPNPDHRAKKRQEIG